ncbi:MAG TPA: PrsW family glutamic-type intramembrane protease [Candidatus Limnocylindrales bacterium]|nr:PrsW family glutamic-type intramembrane protease [Candidatus Limnocylindrales bacterium]
MTALGGGGPSGPCRICDRPATRALHGYAFCEEHHTRALHERGGLWRADLFSGVALLAVVVVAVALQLVARPFLSGPALAIVALVLAVVPAAVWLLLFYRRDRYEPEPRSMVGLVFVAGALLAQAVGLPLVRDVFAVARWSESSLALQLLAGFLIVGLTQESLKYLAVRFTAYETREFDEPTDGVIYGTAAGLGYATVLNIDFVLTSGGADLGMAAIRIVLTALAHASFGGLMGYFLSGQKLRSRPAWWSAAGVALAAAANALFSVVRGSVVGGDLALGGVLLGPWLGLVAAALVAGGLTVLLTRLIRRELEAARSAVEPTAVEPA